MQQRLGRTSSFASAGIEMDGVERTVVFVAREGFVAQRHSRAIERAMPSLQVEQVARLEDALQRFSAPVALILIERGMLAQAEKLAPQFNRLHPIASFAVMSGLGAKSPFEDNDLQASRLIRGIVSMELRPDIWVSIVALLLRGGEYFPRAPRLDLPAVEGKPAKPAIEVRLRSEPKGSLANLTRREMQVLEMISEGRQNKTIASTLNLSENTVKIHVHNVITKLGTHNRTAAASKFHGQFKGDSSVQAGSEM